MKAKVTKFSNKAIILCLVALLSCIFCVIGCSKKPNDSGKVNYNNDPQYLFALNAHINDIRPGVETTLSTEYVGDVHGALGVKRTRLNMSFNDLFEVTRDNGLIFKQSQRLAYRKLIDKYKSVGVTSILGVTDNFLYPYGYETSIDTVVPDPLFEKEEYLLWCQLNAEAYKMIAIEYPEIRYFEPCNEPDAPNGMQLTKNGCSWNNVTANFIYPPEDEAHILADLMWYMNKAVKSVDSNCVVVLPGLCAFISTIDYLDFIYTAIESGCHPTGQQYNDKNPDNYFGILNWHPYPSVIYSNFDKEWIETGWVEFNNQMYAVAQKHGDGDKKVWFSEIGFTDRGFGEAREAEIGSYIAPMYNVVKEKMPYVESLFWYVIGDYYDSPVSTSEDHFGLFYALGDPVGQGKPKAIAKELYTYFHNGSTDYSPLYDVALKHLNG